MFLIEVKDRSIYPGCNHKSWTREAIGRHCSRHPLATNHGATGMNLKTVQELLHHANSRITVEVGTQAISARAASR